MTTLQERLNTTPYEDRWVGLWSPEVMQRIVDGFGIVLTQSGQTSKLNDYDNIHRSILPFLAYQEHAIAFYTGGNSEDIKRNSLKRSRELNRLIGTEEALAILGEINNTTIEIEYLDWTYDDNSNVPENLHYTNVSNNDKTAAPHNEYLKRQNVDINIIQPPGEVLDQNLVTHFRTVVERCLPYTLKLRRVNIAAVSTFDLLVTGTSKASPIRIISFGDEYMVA